MERNRWNERQTNPSIFWRKPRPSLGNNKNETARTKNQISRILKEIEETKG